MKYFDAHCHIQFEKYDGDRTALIEQLVQEGVGGLVVGTDLASSRAAIELVEDLDGFWATVGLHPNHVNDETFDDGIYRGLAMHPKVVAIGECGLDNYRPGDVEAAKPLQRDLFRRQVELSLEADKPLMIHGRPAKGGMDAYEDLLAVLAEYPGARGNIHFFVGTPAIARRFIDLGFTLSFTAVITFARDYDDVIRSIPLDSILSETDSPYVAPAARRGQRNDPRSAKDVVAALAQIRGEDEEVVRAAVLRNARRVFSL
ncbi:MAG TPA: TatD family hydrolase [Candidatus Paceibacterota bacterium]|nr:TatD family hydrolase [Candidatus Paceibacterota bacterium]